MNRDTELLDTQFSGCLMPELVGSALWPPGWLSKCIGTLLNLNVVRTIAGH
jgi:hypothetical protein